MAETTFDAPPPPPPRRSLPDRAKLMAGAAVVVVLAGVGFLLFGSTSSQLGDPIAQAATLSSSAPGYRIKMSVEMSSPALPSPITATGSGVVDPPDHASTVSLEMNFGNDPQVVQALGDSTMRMDVITEGAVVYAKLPAAVTTALPMSGKQWLEIDLAKWGDLPALSSLPSDPTSNDPKQVLRYLQAVSGSVLNEGQQVVGGVETTHYRAAVSLDQLTGTLPSQDRQTYQKMLAELGQSAQSPDFLFDVWVDAQHLVRRTVITIDIGIPNGPSIDETMTADLSDYGPQAKPVLPPAGDVQDLTSLTSAGAA